MSVRILSLMLVLLAAAVPGAATPLDSGDPDQPDPGLPGGGLFDRVKVLDFGFGLQLDRPYQAPGGTAGATLFFFNLTPWDADGAWANYGGLGCRWHILVRDPKGRIVWRPAVPCPRPGAEGAIAPVGPFRFPSGTFLQLPADIPMVYKRSDTSDPDGEPLPGGAYLMEGTHDYSGPVLPAGSGSPGDEVPYLGSGGQPRAEVPFRIVECDGGGGTVPMRTLAWGETSGYRYGDPDFHGEDLVLRTRAAALAFWQEHVSNQFPPHPPPDVDFRTEMVVVTLMGTQSSGGGPSVEIKGVDEYPCHLLVRVLRNHAPGPLDVITNPYHAVAVPRSLKEAVFLHGFIQGPDGDADS